MASYRLSCRLSLNLLICFLICTVIACNIVFVMSNFDHLINTTAYYSMSHWFSVVWSYKHFQGMEKTETVRLASLVDIPMNFNFSQKRKQNTTRHTILWYNKPSWIKSHTFMSSCEYNNCEVVEDKTEIDNASAVVFCPSYSGMGYVPPVKQKQRNTRQAWVFYSLEPPTSYLYWDYRSNSWINTMNWSMTYRLTSDVPAPYGVIRSKAVLPDRNYSDIFRLKTKMAVTISNHRTSDSARELYVQQMRRLGFEVDVCSIKTERVENEQILCDINAYKFFLSFENSFCHDYITEKVFNRFNFDLLLVVRGGADYVKRLPGIPYIDTSKFSNNAELVTYLEELGGNESRYIEMLKRKDKYEGIGETSFGYPYAMCELCRKLNHLDKNQNQIRSIYDYLNSNHCYEPKDLS